MCLYTRAEGKNPLDITKALGLLAFNQNAHQEQLLKQRDLHRQALARHLCCHAGTVTHQRSTTQPPAGLKAAFANPHPWQPDAHSARVTRWKMRVGVGGFGGPLLGTRGPRLGQHATPRETKGMNPYTETEVSALCVCLCVCEHFGS